MHVKYIAGMLRPCTSGLRDHTPLFAPTVTTNLFLKTSLNVNRQRNHWKTADDKISWDIYQCTSDKRILLQLYQKRQGAGCNRVLTAMETYSTVGITYPLIEANIEKAV